jgi:uncharacterized protein involved in type VI secretion and phage assembly
MPKVSGPMLSLRASGTFKNLLVFEDGGSTQRVRAVPASTKPRTPIQRTHMTKIQNLAASWSQQSDSTRAAWSTRALDFGTTGYRLWWREWLTQAIAPPSTPTLP